MNRFLGLSGLIHLAIFAGIIYFCATYDYSSPYKVDKSELEVKATEANPARSSNDGFEQTTPVDEPRLKEVMIEKSAGTKNEESIQATKTMKVMKRAEESQKSISKALPPAKFAPRVEKEQDDVPTITEAAEEGIAHAKTEMEQENKSIEAETQTPVAAAPQVDESTVNDERENLANKSVEEKRALLAKLKAMNAQADEQEKAKKAGEGSNSAAAGNGNASATHSDSEVRGVENFRQQAGNPRPAYDNDDRLKGRQGIVVFHAFVTDEGQAKDFELIESSGHRSLDLKTLKALKQWKFQPGQEGWVEIPFRWDLKGGPQELPSTLRKKVSTKQDSIAK